MTRTQLRIYTLAGLVLLALVLTSGTAISADNLKIQGAIKGRSGATMIVQPSDSAEEVIVVLTDQTQVGQIQGVLKARRKEMSMAALIPGLIIQVEGRYNEQRQLIAKSVKFKGSDLQQAQSIQAGLHETQSQANRNTEELQKQNAALQAQNEELKQQ